MCVEFCVVLVSKKKGVSPVGHSVCLIATWYKWCNTEVLGPLVKEVGAGFVVGFCICM